MPRSYHHVPGGKKELFVEVTERHLHQHRRGLDEALTQAQSDVRSQLYAVTQCFLSQPPMDVVRISYTDMPAIDPKSGGTAYNHTQGHDNLHL